MQLTSTEARYPQVASLHSPGNVGRNDSGCSDHSELEAALDCIDTEKLVEALSPPAGQRASLSTSCSDAPYQRTAARRDPLLDP